MITLNPKLANHICFTNNYKMLPCARWQTGGNQLPVQSMNALGPRYVHKVLWGLQAICLYAKVQWSHRSYQCVTGSPSEPVAYLAELG